MLHVVVDLKVAREVSLCCPAFFSGFLERNPEREITLVRAFEGGGSVFVHAHQRLGSDDVQWVTMDMFDFDADGRIVEHWDCIEPYVGPLPSGHTQIDGPAEPAAGDSAANVVVVHGLLQTVFRPGGDPERAREFISAERYVQHSDGLADGVDALVQALAGFAATGREAAYEIRKTVAQGSFVATLSRVLIGGEERAAMDLFRLQDGLIVEHWDCTETIGPPETWNNSGKF